MRVKYNVSKYMETALLFIQGGWGIHENNVTVFHSWWVVNACSLISFFITCMLLHKVLGEK